MALNRLSTAEMITISSRWVEPKGAARKAIQSTKETAAVLPSLDAAHAALLDTQPRAPDSGRPAAIGEEAARLDLRHDAVSRAADQILAGLAVAADNPEPYLRLQEALLPGGLSALKRSYLDEAGQAALLDERLGTTERAALKAIPVLGGSLLDLVTERIGLGRRLGQLEDERIALLRNKPAGPTQAEVVTARNRWIRATNALISMAELADLSADTQQVILGSLRHAEQAAARRGGRRAAGEPSTAEPAPEPAGA